MWFFSVLSYQLEVDKSWENFEFVNYISIVFLEIENLFLYCFFFLLGLAHLFIIILNLLHIEFLLMELKSSSFNISVSRIPFRKRPKDIFRQNYEISLEFHFFKPFLMLLFNEFIVINVF